MSEIARYPANYNHRNLSLLLSKIDGRSCVTLISPAGYGKSKLLRFLTENPHCKKLPGLRNIEFLFLDLARLNAVQKQEELSPILANHGNPHLPQFLMQEIRRFYQHKGWDVNAEFANVDLDRSPEQIHDVMEKLLGRLKKKSIYIILDNFTTLFTPDRKHDLQLVKTLRNHQTSKVQYIFSITGTRYLNEEDNPEMESVSSLLMHRVVLMRMVDVRQIMFGSLEPLGKLISWVRRHLSSKYSRNLRYIQRRTGGYLPYTRYFLDPMHLPEENELIREFDMCSRRLLESLTPQQQQIMRGIATGNLEDVKKGDLAVLREAELIKDTSHGLELFSPIMREYFSRH